VGTTTYSALRYPEANAVPYVNIDFKHLADDVDERLFVECTSGTRPGHLDGRRILETDTKRTLVSVGGAWKYLEDFDTGSPTPAWGTYAGERLRFCAGRSSFNTNGSSLATWSIPHVPAGWVGLLAVHLTCLDDPNHQHRFVDAGTFSAVGTQWVLRTAAGAGAGATTCNFRYIAVGF